MAIKMGSVVTGYDNTVRDGWVTQDDVRDQMKAFTDVISVSEQVRQVHPDTHELIRTTFSVKYDNSSINIPGLKAVVKSVLGTRTNGLPSENLLIPNPLLLLDLKTTPDGLKLTSWPIPVHSQTGASYRVRVDVQQDITNRFPQGIKVLGSTSKFEPNAESFEDGQRNTDLEEGVPNTGTMLNFNIRHKDASDFAIPANSIIIEDESFGGGPLALVHSEILCNAEGSGGVQANFTAWVTNELNLFMNRNGEGLVNGVQTPTPLNYADALAAVPTRKL